MYPFLSSLRFRIVLIIFFAMLPALGLVVNSAREQRQLAERNVQEEALHLAKITSMYQEHLFEEGRQLLLALAQIPAVRQGDSVACSAFLSQLLEKNPTYSQLGVLDAQGNLICSALPRKDPTTESDRLYFQRVLKTKAFAVGDLQIGQVSRKATLHLAYPVLDESGRVKRVIFAGLALDWIKDLATQVQVAAEATFTVIDRTGIVMARHPDPEKWVGRPLPEDEIIRTVLARGQGVAEARDVDKVQHLYAFAPLGRTAQLGYVYVGIPTKTIFAAAFGAFLRNLLLLGCVAFIALAAAELLGYLFIVRRVNILVNATRQLAAGDLTVRTGLSYGKGEIDQLARAFDETAQALQLREAERQQAEKAQRQSENRFRELFNNMRSGVAVYDVMPNGEDFILEDFNRAAEQIEKLKKEDLLGKNVQEIFPGVEELGLLEVFKRVYHTGQGEHFPAAFYHDERIKGWRENYVYKLPSGEIVAVYDDVTVRKQAVEALATERQRFLSLLNNLPAFMYLRGPDYSIRFANRSFVEIFGDPEGKPCYEAIQGRKEPCERCQSSQVLSNGKPHQWELTCGNPERSYQTHGYSFTDSDGTPVVLTLGIDITERKQAEAALKGAHQTLQAVIQSSLVPIISLDSQDRVSVWNSAAQEVFGWEEQEVLGQFLPNLLDENMEEFRQIQARVGQGGVVRKLETLSRKKDGSIINTLLNAGPLYDVWGHVVGSMAVVEDITAHKRAEEALRQSEEKYRLLVNQIPAVVFTGYADWSVDFFDRKIESVTGYPKDDFDARRLKWTDLILPEDLWKVKRKSAKALKGDRSYVREYRIRKKTGEIVWVQSLGRIFLTPEGKVDYVSGALFDITERKRAEETLKESERNYRLLVNQIPAVVFKGYADWGVDFFDRKAEDLTGYLKADFESRRLKWADLIHPEDLPGVKKIFYKALKGDQSYVREYRIKPKSRETLWVQEHGQIFLNPERKVDFISGLFFDITERRLVEEALRESEARFRATFEDATVGIELVDANGQMAETNPALQKMLGYSREELRGRSFTDFTHPDDIPSSLEFFQNLMHGKRSSYQMEKRYIRKDGGIVWVNVAVSKTFVMEGRPSLAINLVEDITEHKLADERVRAYQEQLRSLTSELTRAEERERRQLAEELHDQIGQLLAVSKMKMGALKKKAAAAGLEKPLEEVRGYLDQAIKSTRSLTHELAPPLVHLGLEGALEWLAEQLQTHYGLTVTLEKDDRPKPLGLETSTMLFRAVRELLMNVVKHAQAHQARVAILRPDGELHIEVQDDGVGLAPGKIDPKLGEAGKFGLFSIMERLQSVGGQLKIDSQPGQGTTVTIIMPLEAEDASATEE